MKLDLLSKLRGFLLAGTALTASMTAGFVCNSPPPYGQGSLVWDCSCVCPDATQDFIAEVCGDNGQQAMGNCVGRCSQSGCVNAALDGPYSGEGCSGAQGAGLWSGPGPHSSEASMDSERSVAAMTLWGEPTSVGVDGDVSFRGGCESGTCSIAFDHMSFAPNDFAFRGPEGEIKVEHLTLLNQGVIAGTQTETVFTIPSEQVSLLVDGFANGSHKSYLLTLNRGEDFSGYYIPSSGKFGITARFSQEGEALELALDLRGTATARPPVANAGRSQEVAADRGRGTAKVTLDGSATVDYDDNLVGIDWYEGERYLGSGIELDVELGIGRHTLTAVASDDTRKTDSADTTVTVDE